MPAMLRWNKKAKKIAEKIMGKPDNEVDDSSRKQKKIKHHLIVEEGQWAR